MARRWIVENKWNCTSCRVQNLGRAMTCKSCGSPKEQDEKYILGDTTKEVKDSTRLHQAHAGRNWPCSFCRFDNRNFLERCEQCGADRFEKQPATSEPRATPAPHQTKAQAYAPSRPKIPTYKVSPPLSDEFPPPDFRPRSSRSVFLALGAVGVVFFIGLLIWLFSPHEHDAQVSSVHWTYTRTLEQRYTRDGSGWGHPAGAFDVHCSRRQRGTENCHPHDCNPHSVSYDCNPTQCNCRQSCSDLGNGYSSCQESCSTCYSTCSRTEYDTCYDQCPVYDDWCTYRYYEWVFQDREVTQGNDHAVRWGTRLTANASIPQRILQSEEYNVVFSQADDTWTYRPDTLAAFRLYEVGVVWDVKTNYAGMIWPVHPEPSR